jgi:hypothetical protein
LEDAQHDVIAQARIDWMLFRNLQQSRFGVLFCQHFFVEITIPGEIMKQHTLHFGLSVLLLTGLVGCGGGGDTLPIPVPQVSTDVFWPRDAYRLLVKNGMSKTFTVSGGTCSGTGTDVRAPASITGASTPLDGWTTWPVVRTFAPLYQNCTVPSTTVMQTVHINSDYDPIGVDTAGVSYGVYQPRTDGNAPLHLPASVHVGDSSASVPTGPLPILGTLNLYTDAAATTSAGKIVGSWAIEQDSPSTAIVNLTWKTYNAAGTLTSTEQDRYRVAKPVLSPEKATQCVNGLCDLYTSPPLEVVSVDIVDQANGNHLVFTYN